MRKTITGNIPFYTRESIPCTVPTQYREFVGVHFVALGQQNHTTQITQTKTRLEKFVSEIGSTIEPGTSTSHPLGYQGA